MRQPTIHQMRKESFIEEKSSQRKSKRFSIEPYLDQPTDIVIK
jgi:hypothetical protein